MLQIGDHGKTSAGDGLNDGLKLSERLKYIFAIVEENPIITVDEIANRLHVSKPTTEREIAFLKSKNILLRIDSKKAGSWKINRDQK